MPHDLPKLTEALLDVARKAGAEAADALAVAGNAQSIDIRRGKLEQAERSEGVEIGLRVLLGGRQACVSASDISPATMARLAERAVAMAREAPEDPTVGLASQDQIARHWDLAAFDLADPTDEPTPQQLEAAARAVVATLDGVHMSPPPPPYTAGFFASDLFHPSASGYRDWARFAVADAAAAGVL